MSVYTEKEAEKIKENPVFLGASTFFHGRISGLDDEESRFWRCPRGGGEVGGGKLTWGF